MEERPAVLSAMNFRGNVPKPGSAPRGAGGFTFIELVIAMMIIGIVAAIAIPSFQKYLLKNKEATAISEIATIAAKLKEIMMENPTALPPDLSTINVGVILPLIDPWGNPYLYLPLYGLSDKEARAIGARKNGNDFPISHDFDLYSMGPDGVTKQSIKNSHSRDDIIRADEGGFIGRASVYEP